MSVEASPTRRQLVWLAATLAGGATIRPALALAATPATDGQLLAQARVVEELLAWAYDRVLEMGTLGDRARRAVAAFRDQEHEHVLALKRLGASGGKPPTLNSASAILARHGVGASLTALETEHACLRLLVDLESLAEGSWFTLIGKLADPALAGFGASIMGCEAQHWSVLSGLAHHEDVKISVPYPFVRGSSGY